MTNQKNDNNTLTIVAFFLNLAMCIFSFTTLMKSFDKNVLWKEIASSISFMGFLIFMILLVRKIIKLRKVSVNRNS